MVLLPGIPMMLLLFFNISAGNRVKTPVRKQCEEMMRLDLVFAKAGVNPSSAKYIGQLPNFGWEIGAGRRLDCASSSGTEVKEADGTSAWGIAGGKSPSGPLLAKSFPPLPAHFCQPSAGG